MCVCGTSEKTCNFFSCFKGYLQGACGHHANGCQRSYAWWWKQSLINSVHLLFQFCNLLYSGNGTAKPRTASPTYSTSCTFAAIWTLDGLFPYLVLCLYNSFSPTFRFEGMDQHWKPLVRALDSLRYSRYSTWLSRWVHLRGLLQFTICFGFAWLGFSSHWITTMIHFLSSVCLCGRSALAQPFDATLRKLNEVLEQSWSEPNFAFRLQRRNADLPLTSTNIH